MGVSTLAGWENFFVAEVGASATLAGFVFVAASINLTKIMTYPGLPNRILESLVVLLVVLLISSLHLVPGQSSKFSGGEMLLIGLLAWMMVSQLHVVHLRKVERQHRWQALVEALLGQAAMLPFIITGIVVIASGAESLLWIALGTMCSFLIVFYNAWVLLIEVNR